MKLFLGVLATALLAAGCQSYYTGIQKDGPNSYTLTEINQGFFRIYGTVYRCEGTGSSMRCRKIDSE